MKQISRCSECGTTLPPDAPRGFCPRCLMKAGIESEDQPTGASETASGMSIYTNLLFGVQALKLGLIDSTQLTEACAAAMEHGDSPLADILVGEGTITPEQGAKITRLVEEESPAETSPSPEPLFPLPATGRPGPPRAESL